MRRWLVLALLVAGCGSPAQPITLQPCDWSVKTTLGMGEGFACLDGKAAPTGLPAPAIVNVWGSWCAPCREEIPYFVQLDKKYKTTIIGVDVDEPRISKGQQFALASKMSWPNLIDLQGKSTSIYGPGVPVTWFIDSSGKVVNKKIGAWSSYEELEKAAKKYGMIK